MTHLAIGSVCPYCRQHRLTRHCPGARCDLLQCPGCTWRGTPDQTRQITPKEP